MKEPPGCRPPRSAASRRCWEADYRQWSQRDLSRRRYVYVWADGVYSNVRMDDRLCLLVIVGSDDTGRKEVLAVVDGYRESEASWLEVIEQLESQGLTIPPKLAIGDGALGFWKAHCQEMAPNGSTALLGAQDGERAEQGAEIGATEDQGGAA